jgi:hypothetical protein
MDEAQKSDKNVMGGSGITASGNVNIGDVSGQVAIGENNEQTQSISIEQTDLEELRKSLLDFQKGIAQLGLSSEDQSIVNDDITAALKEAKKDKPVLSKIKEKFESAITTVKEAGKTIQDLSELYEPAKKIAKLVGVGLSLLL